MVDEIKPDNIKKILIVKLSAIGDVIHALPVARVLRENYPDAEISWVVEEKSRKILEDNPHLDQVIVFPKASLKERFRDNKLATVHQLINFFKNLRKNKFDLALDLQGLFKSGLITYFSGARLRVGYSDAREGSTIFYNQKINPESKEIPVVDRYLNLVKKLGLRIDDVQFDIMITANEKKKIDELLSDFMSDKVKQNQFYWSNSVTETGRNQIKIKTDIKLIVINPFTSWSSKNWLKDRYAELAARLIRELDCRIIFTGGPGDRKGIDQIISLLTHNQADKVLNLAGKTSLKELAELYSRADLFVGGDTGPMHLAVAMNTTVVALMGPTNPVRNGPYGQGHHVIQKDIECKNCWKRICSAEEHYCMKNIEVDELFEVSRKYLI